MPVKSDPVRQTTELTLDSPLRDVLAEFVIVDVTLLPDPPALTVYDNRLSVVWADTSRVNLTVGVMPAAEGAVAIIVPPYEEVEGGANPNNPGYVEPPPTPVDPAVLESLEPDQIVAGGSGFNLLINGTGFTEGSTIQFGTAQISGSDIGFSDTQLSIFIGPDGYAQPGPINVTVTNSEGEASNALVFTAT